MEDTNWQMITAAREAAVEVLIHNAEGPFDGLPRTAGWGYPEPYTRDLLISVLGIAVSENSLLTASIRRGIGNISRKSKPSWAGSFSGTR